MRENKPRFELAAKIIGLMLVVAGVWMALDAILVAFHVPVYQSMDHGFRMTEFQSGVQTGHGVWKTVLFILLFKSALPILLGIYLMKPDNMFSAYTFQYVQRTAGSPEIHRTLDILDREDFDSPFAMGAAAFEEGEPRKTFAVEGASPEMRM